MLTKIKNKNKTKAIINKEKNDKKHKEVTNSNKKTGNSEFPGSYILFKKYAEKDNNKTICVISDYETAFKLTRNNKVCYITHDRDNYEKFRKLVDGSIKFGNDAECFFVDDIRDYPNKIDSYQKTFFNEINNNMKQFDKIIMNPPYDNNLHLKILVKVIEINPDAEIVCLHPAKWFDSMFIEHQQNYHETLFIRKHVSEIVRIPSKEMNELFNISFGDCVISTFRPGKVMDNKCYSSLTPIIEKMSSKCNYDKLLKEHNIPTKHFVRISRYMLNSLMSGNRAKFIDGYSPNGVYAKSNWTEGRDKYDEFYFNSETEVYNVRTLNDTFLAFLIPRTFLPTARWQKKYIPIPDDYTQPWTNERLKDYFELTDEEYKFIMEQNV